MADYKDYYKSDCIFCGSHSDHREDCRSPYMDRLRATKAIEADGFTLVSEFAHRVEMYKCLNGCGSMVWDMKSHRENVCFLDKP